MNVHIESSVEMKRKYADACIGGALNSCIARARNELERRAKKRIRRLEASRVARERFLAKRRAEGLGILADDEVSKEALQAREVRAKKKALLVASDDMHVERMRNIAQSISDIPRTGDISARIGLFLHTVRGMKARDFYAVDDYSSAAAFEVADEILPFAEKLKSQLHLSLSYPDKAAIQATEIENKVRTLSTAR
jgi:hypothetical protein